jgi:hypothetical protein
MRLRVPVSCPSAGALHSPLEKHSVLGRAMIEAAALAAAGPAFEELRPVTVLASVRRQQAEREDAERSMSQLAGRLKGGRWVRSGLRLGPGNALLCCFINCRWVRVESFVPTSRVNPSLHTPSLAGARQSRPLRRGWADCWRLLGAGGPCWLYCKHFALCLEL